MSKVYVISAFSKDSKGGNKAGVVLDCADLSSVDKMRIAKDLGYSETAFVLDSEVADFQVQYFTPTEEVPVCGHATIATFSLLNRLEMLNRRFYTIETKAGILKIEVKEAGMILMQQNCPRYLDILSAEQFEECMESVCIDSKLPIQIVTTGLKDVLLPIDTKESLFELQPNFEKMTDLSRENEVVGVHAFTLVNDMGIDAICRNFAPLYGIDEESATGTASCALASYLFKYVEKKSQYVFEQGHNLGAISRIIVNVSFHDDVIEEICVGGYGYLVEERI